MSTFGFTSIGTGSAQALLSGEKAACRFALTEAPVRVTKLTAYVDGLGAGTGNQVVKGILHSDNTGEPDALLGTTNEVTITDGQAAGWVEFAFASPVALASAADYWIGLLGGTNGATVQYYYNLTGGDFRSAADAYADGPEDPWGASDATEAYKVSIYATYSLNISGTGAAQTAAATLAGTGHYDITGTGAVQTGAATLAGTGHYDITGTGALTIGSPTLSGSIWMNSADLRHVAGRAWLYGVSGKAEIYGLLGKAEM